MATQTKTAGEASLDEAADRVRELNERIVESTRKAGGVYLDAYEKALSGLADLQERVADVSQIEWVQAVANAQASFVRDLGNAYVAAAREVLK